MSNDVINPAAIPELENKQDNSIRIKTIGAEIVSSREAQEVQVAMIAAKHFPRDIVTAYNRIIDDCKRISLAERAMYEYPRAGAMIVGPSIHLAKSMARSWGNLDSGFKILEQSAKESIVMAYCWDLETNYRETKVFTVKHVRETKDGAYPITSERDIYELIANQASRRERSCILSVIPNDIVEAAVGQCNATISGDSKVPLVDAIRTAVKMFQEKYGVTIEMIEKYIGCKKEAFSQQSIIRLKRVYNTLKDGSASPEQYFDFSIVSPKNNESETEDQIENKPVKNKTSLKDIE